MQGTGPDSEEISKAFMKYLCYQDESNRMSLLENPPMIRPNAPEFSVYSVARSCVISSWCQSFLSELDYQFNSQPLLFSYPPNNKTDVFPKSVGLGLKIVFSLIKNSRNSHPDVCKSTLKVLLDTLDNFKPEDLVKDPPEIIDEIFETLIELSTVSADSASSCDSEIASLSCSCLLALVVASGNNTKFIMTILHLLKTAKGARDNCIMVPKILTSFHGAVKHIAIGSNETICFMQDGIQKENIITELPIPFPVSQDCQSGCSVFTFVSDSSYLYLFTVMGIFKIGTGFADTAGSVLFQRSSKSFMNCISFHHKGSIYIIEKDVRAIGKVNQDTLNISRLRVKLPKEFFNSKAIHYPDTEHIGLIYPNDQDQVILNLYDIVYCESHDMDAYLILVKKVFLNLAKQYTYILGSSSLDGSHSSCFEPTKIHHELTIASVTAGQNFTLCRTTTGQVYFNGNTSVLGLKSNTASYPTSAWNHLYMGKNINIVDMAVGHEGLHAVIITDSGIAYYYGTPQRGEDGDTHKYRKNQPIRGKPFSKLEHEVVINASCNYLSSALVTRSGRLYIYGKDNQYCNSSGLMNNLTNHCIVQVCLGKGHGLALTDDGLVITFGINNKGQCGRFHTGRTSKFCQNHKHRWENDLCTICTKCHKCTGFKNCTNSSPEVIGSRRICGCGEGYSGCLDCGMCLSCARKTKHPQKTSSVEATSSKRSVRHEGSPSRSPSRGSSDECHSPIVESRSKKANLSPEIIAIQARIISVSCGLHHSVVLSDQGEVFTFGLNSFGQLGAGDTNTHNKIIRVDIPKKAVQIAAGSNHTVILMENGDVLTMGANNKGQLGRQSEDNSLPKPVAHFGASKGFKATWIGASGEQTFIKLDESIVNLNLLQNSVICGDKHNLLVIPASNGSSSKQLLINKKDGECLSYDKKHTVKFHRKATVFDPGFDLVWDLDSVGMKIVAYGHSDPRSCRNSQQLNFTLPEFDSQLKPREQTRPCSKKGVNVLTKELALPNIWNKYVSKEHIAMNLMSCIDTLICNEKDKLFFLDYSAEYELDKRSSEYQQVHRFTSTTSSWKYGQDTVEAIRFSADTSLVIGGCVLYGSRGVNKIRLQIYNIGFDGGDIETSGELLAETEELTCDAPSKNKFIIMLKTPVIVKAHCWYVVSVVMKGPPSEYGTGGLDEIVTSYVTFQFKTSKKSTNGTDTSKGQIASLLYKKYQRLENTSHDIEIDPIFQLKCLYSRDLSPVGLQALNLILQWSWKNLIVTYQDIQKLDSYQHSEKLKTEVNKYLNPIEKEVIVFCLVLRLIKRYLMGIYPLVPPKKYIEKSEFIDIIYDIRKQLNIILSYDRINIEKKLTARNEIKHCVTYSHEVMLTALSVVQNVYEEIFYILYPSPQAKWKQLCHVLSLVDNLKDRKHVFLLMAVCSSLTKCLTLRKVLQYIVVRQFTKQSEPTEEGGDYSLLILKMTNVEHHSDSSTFWDFNEAISNLLKLIKLPTLKKIKYVNEARSEPLYPNIFLQQIHNDLVQKCCSLVIRIISELAQFSTEDNIQSSIDTKDYLVTPSRFCFTNPVSTMLTKKGFPDAIAFEVDTPGILLHGITVYASVEEYIYEIEILVENSQSSKKEMTMWSSLDYKKGLVQTYDREPLEIKFNRPIPIKENTKYAIRLWHFGRPLKTGCQGVPVVKGSDNTVFKFSKCDLSMTGTNVSIGQIPSLIYTSQNKASTLGVSFDIESQQFKKIVVTTCLSIIRDSLNMLLTTKGPYWAIDDAANNSVLLESLLPNVISQLCNLKDTENSVDILNILKDTLPVLVKCNLSHRKNITHTAASYCVTVESDHPYKHSNVSIHCVKFPPNVGFLVVEMDPRSGTCQPEDYLSLYIHSSSGRRSSPIPCPLTNSNSPIVLKHQEKGGVPSTYIPIGQKTRLNAVVEGVLLPGNEVLFLLETAADYIKDDKANKFGFKCQVFGYESLTERYTVLQKLELDLVHLAGVCATSLINPDISPISRRDLKDKSPIIDDFLTGDEYQDPLQSILSNGLALERLPTVQEALNGVVQLRHKGKKHQFLQDFIKRTKDTSGGRLACWLQPDSFVDPENCFLVPPTEKIISGEKCVVELMIRDQHDKPVTSLDIFVEITAHQEDIVRVRQDLVAQSTQPPVDVPYSVTIKENMNFHSITMMRPYQNYSFEEVRLASPTVQRTTEHLIIRSITKDKVTATWTPQSPGVYIFDCSIDGYSIQKNAQVQVCEPLHKRVPPITAPMCLQKPDVNNVRTFVDEDSAGLRIRASPSLQGEQIGLVPGRSLIVFEDVTMNSDGVWIKLTNACASNLLGTTTHEGEAWCMQFNQHLGKSLLLPNEIDNNKDPLANDNLTLSETSDVKYRIIRTCEVKEKPMKTAATVGILKVGDVVDSPKLVTTIDGESWANFSNLNLTSKSSEYWVPVSCLQIISKMSSPEQTTSPVLNRSEVVPKRVPKFPKKRLSLRKKTSEKSDTSSSSEATAYIMHIERQTRNLMSESFDMAQQQQQRSKSVSFGGAIKKVRLEDMGTDKMVESDRHSPKRFYESQSKERTPPESPQIEFAVEEHIEETFQIPENENEQQEPKPTKGISPSRAESLRTSFAAFLWHEGIVDDALTCASYLKFHPNLPKEGAEVITRPPQMPSTSQRHSVEVTNAGNYLNIQQSTLETLNKSALNASASRNRKRHNKDVTVISEEESVHDSCPSVGDVVCVLPAALKVLVALWEEFNILDVSEETDRTVHGRVTSPPKKCSDKDSSQHSTDSDDNYFDFNEVFQNCEKQVCELCLQLVSLPMTRHYARVHPGCGRYACKGYTYTGLFTQGWFGKCGTTETIKSNLKLGLGYVFCDVCRNKALRNLRIRTEGGQVNDPPVVPNVNNFIMMSNATFLLDMEPIHHPDENTQAPSEHLYVDQWDTPNTYNNAFIQMITTEVLKQYYREETPKIANTVHRSASMSIKNITECSTNSSLLCNPSKALVKFIEFGGSEQAISSIGSVNINKEFFHSRPSLELLCQGEKDIQRVKRRMLNTIRGGVIRQYGLQALNWLIHIAGESTSLHEVMWLFCGAMMIKSTTSSHEDARNLEESEDVLNVQWWSDFLAGNTLRREVRLSLHSFLQSISDLIPSFPLSSPLLLQAIQCWGINFVSEDHQFIQNSQIFSNISKILSMADGARDVSEGTNQDMDIVNDTPGPVVTTIPDITYLCTFTVSSRQDMVEYLTDGSTETFWESSDENRTKPRTIDITLPQGVNASSIWLHLDNVRDTVTRALGVGVTYYGADGLQKDIEMDVGINFFGWLCINLIDTSPINRGIHCEIRGICNLVRVRQIKVLGNLVEINDPIPSMRSVITQSVQKETLRVFHNIAYQVFGPVIFDDTLNANEVLNRPLSIIEDGHYNGQNDLREHVVGILFSQETLTILQKQLMVHIVNAITSEAQRTREIWESNLRNINDSTMLNDQDLEINEYQDNFCYEMISMVLTLSGCPLGRSSLSKHSFLIRDLLTLLHTGSARVQRQVIATLRRMIHEVTPAKMMSALNGNIYNGNVTSKETFIDHLIICISKSLRVQVKNRNGGSATISQPVTMAGTMGQCSPDPATPWYYRGYMSKRHAQMIIQLLNDMIKDKMPSSWSQSTKMSIAEYILALTSLTDDERTPSRCISSPVLWRAMGSLCVVTEDQANRLNNKGWQNTSKEAVGSESPCRPLCVNHDDGETLAMIECTHCGPMCQDCDRFLHLSKTNRQHQRQVCKEEVTSIQVELHEGCGRVKLFWLLAFVDQRSLKSIIEFRLPVMNKFTVISSKSTGQCRFCGAHGDSGLLSIGNVCAEKECQEHSGNACSRILSCGHHCGGYRGEVECLPCLYGCAMVGGDTPQQEEAASRPTPHPPPLRQDAEDMCMICFSDRLVAAPAVLLLCGHVFHYHCTKKILENRWNGPRISFTFSLCPICKAEIDHPAFKELLEPIRHLQKDVRSKALIRLEYESLTNAAIIATRYNNSAIDYAMDRYSYYVCFMCKKAYFGGEAHCDAENTNTNSSYNPAELVCGGCSDVTQSKMCKLHGSDYLEYKCRYCCSIAIFFCLGDTHFCGGCHDQFQVIRRLSLDELPHCPAGPKGVQLEGTSDDCPLRVKHPPTGYEFALGCGICRNNTNF